MPTVRVYCTVSAEQIHTDYLMEKQRDEQTESTPTTDFTHSLLRVIICHITVGTFDDFYDLYVRTKKKKRITPMKFIQIIMLTTRI